MFPRGGLASIAGGVLSASYLKTFKDRRKCLCFPGMPLRSVPRAPQRQISHILFIQEKYSVFSSVVTREALYCAGLSQGACAIGKRSSLKPIDEREMDARVFEQDKELG